MSVAAALGGVAAGLALLAFQVSNARSYLSDAPETCINCHVMNGWYAGWAHSSHRAVAVCNDCHVPHDCPVLTYAFKAYDGARHSFVFTMRLEPQVLQLNPAAVPVVRDNCVRCHEHQVMETSMVTQGGIRDCWECHRETPHGLAQSLSSSPAARRPALPAAGAPRPAGRPGSVPGTKGAGE